MADKTAIEWADATLNYVNGCTRISPGCGGPGNAGGCYAERLAATRMRNVPSRAGLAEMTPNGPRWTGKINTDDRALDQALRWRRPRRIFWNAHGDLFHESVPDATIDRLFAVCALTPHHTHMILTKRAGRMREYLTSAGLDGFLDNRLTRIQDAAYRQAAMPSGKWSESAGMAARQACVDALHRIDDRTNAGFRNVWLGVSVEDQQRADERIPDLLNTPAAIRFISAEPLLGPVDLTRICIVRRVTKSPRAGIHINAVTGRYVESGMPYIGDWDVSKPYPTDAQPLTLDWVITGGESGPGGRPMHPDWARSLRDQCAAAGVPFLFKQWGEWAPVCEMSGDLTESIYHPAPAHSPEAARRCKVDQCDLHRDGTRFHGRAMYGPGAFWQGTGAMTMFEVGKAKAGRLLDGVVHNEFPQVRHG